MRGYIAIFLIFALIGIGIVGISASHHQTNDGMSCAAVCLQAVRPVSIAILATLLVAFFVLLTSTAGKISFFAPLFSYRDSTSPGVQFRQKFSRWFSQLEHSPTA